MTWVYLFFGVLFCLGVLGFILLLHAPGDYDEG